MHDPGAISSAPTGGRHRSLREAAVSGVVIGAAAVAAAEAVTECRRRPGLPQPEWRRISMAVFLRRPPVPYQLHVEQVGGSPVRVTPNPGGCASGVVGVVVEVLGDGATTPEIVAVAIESDSGRTVPEHLDVHDRSRLAPLGARPHQLRPGRVQRHLRGARLSLEPGAQTRGHPGPGGLSRAWAVARRAAAGSRRATGRLD